MKTFTKYIFASFLALAAVACNKAALEKEQVEAGFASKGTPATITIDKNIVSDGASATVSVTVSGLKGSALDSLSFGVLASLTEDFANTTFAQVDAKEDGTYTVKVPVTSLTTTYFKAAVSSIHNTFYSETVSAEIPDAPLRKKIAGKWKMKAISYFDETVYSTTWYIEATDKEDEFIVKDFEPFFLGNGFTKEKNCNIFNAKLYEEEGVLLVEGGLVKEGTSYYCIGNTEDNNIPIMLDKSGQSGSIDVIWGAYGSSGWYEAYGETTLTR